MEGHFPKVMYKPNKEGYESVLVATDEELKALGADWKESPEGMDKPEKPEPKSKK